MGPLGFLHHFGKPLIRNRVPCRVFTASPMKTMEAIQLPKLNVGGSIPPARSNHSGLKRVSVVVPSPPWIGVAVGPRRVRIESDAAVVRPGN
jgi:hypothetical protein